MANDGSRPVASNAVAIIAEVVVLPCAPATVTTSRPAPDFKFEQFSEN
jgi:hypothetical protein